MNICLKIGVETIIRSPQAAFRWVSSFVASFHAFITSSHAFTTSAVWVHIPVGSPYFVVVWILRHSTQLQISFLPQENPLKRPSFEASSVSRFKRNLRGVFVLHFLLRAYEKYKVLPHYNLREVFVLHFLLRAYEKYKVLPHYTVVRGWLGSHLAPRLPCLPRFCLVLLMAKRMTHLTNLCISMVFYSYFGCNFANFHWEQAGSFLWLGLPVLLPE